MRDFDYILDLIQKYIDFGEKDLESKKKKAIEDDPDLVCLGEYISDIAHYKWVDEQFLWQFALWRFQGIFEGIINTKLLPEELRKDYGGLKTKLNGLEEAGYILTEEESRELRDWATLRNILSHTPPECYRPGPLREEDVLEYMEFLKTLLARWLQQ